MPSQHGAPAPQHDSTIMQTIVLANAKGGTGKSTLAAGLAVAASQAGETVIALDLDPQGSLGDGAMHARLARPPSTALKAPAWRSSRKSSLR